MTMDMKEARKQVQPYLEYLDRPTVKRSLDNVADLYGKESTRKTVKENMATYLDGDVEEATLEILVDEALKSPGECIVVGRKEG